MNSVSDFYSFMHGKAVTILLRLFRQGKTNVLKAVKGSGRVRDLTKNNDMARKYCGGRVEAGIKLLCHHYEGMETDTLTTLRHARYIHALHGNDRSMCYTRTAQAATDRTGCPFPHSVCPPPSRTMAKSGQYTIELMRMGWKLDGG